MVGYVPANERNVEMKNLFRFDLGGKKSIKSVRPPYKNFCPLEYPDQIWNTREDGSLDIGHVNDEPSLTQQQFKDECDINNIMKSYLETGTINHKNPMPGVFGDFSEVKDFKESMELVLYAQQAFDSLPAKVRARFDNDPAKLVEFCNDKNNLKEAIELGLADSPVVPSNANDDLTTNANSGTKKGSSKPNTAVSPSVKEPTE